MAPDHLIDLCRPVASIDGRGRLQVRRIKRSTYGSRTFGHTGPPTWNTHLKTAHTLYLLLDVISNIHVSLLFILLAH